MSNDVKLTASAWTIVALTALGACTSAAPSPSVSPFPTRSAEPIVGPTEPGAAASPAASPTSRPNEQQVTGFAVPFSYVLPDGADFEYGTRNETWWEVRIPAAFEAGHPAGVIVQAIGDGRSDPCDVESSAVPIDAGAQPVIDYLRTVPDLAVSSESPTSVGELPAVQAHVSAAASTSCNEGVWPWMERTESFVALPAPAYVRLVATEVNGEHIVFTVFGEADNPDWSAMAAELIDSFRFLTE